MITCPPLLCVSFVLLLFTPVCNGLSLFNFNKNIVNGGGGGLAASVTNKLPSPPQSDVKILILPGFGNDAMDYTMPGSLVDSLKEQGWCVGDDDADGNGSSSNQVAVLPVRRTDWLQVFTNGVWDWNFWMGNADPTRPAFRWYLERISEQVEELCRRDNETGGGDSSSRRRTRVILVGHSAGGWLGRAAMGFGSDGDADDEDGGEADGSRTTIPSGPPINMDNILGLVSLGAPHLPPPATVMDMTRGALRITNERFPGSYHANRDGIFYVTAVGLAVRGEKQQQRRQQSPLEPTTVTGFAYSSYEAVCGDGTVMGDGVVPYCAAHLDDAVQLDLDGVFHSINAPDNWYGSSRIIERWHTPMLRELQRTVTNRKKTTSSKYAQNDVLAAISGVLDKLKS